MVRAGGTDAEEAVRRKDPPEDGGRFRDHDVDRDAVRFGADLAHGAAAVRIRAVIVLLAKFQVSILVLK